MAANDHSVEGLLSDSASSNAEPAQNVKAMVKGKIGPKVKPSASSASRQISQANSSSSTSIRYGLRLSVRLMHCTEEHILYFFSHHQ
eukprot:TRINITY_DN3911_c1_g1_i1.p1 TRINITY_DN3911_c1_g1~~TRINITY_DN3911_c1_g1_i1.p1  ORF type:complete len:101 (+),score=10.24 TRINITY_DN3911_c1_g1_i1:45-305(+)